MEYQRLSAALEMLDNTTKEFPIGAISIDDFMPVEDKIKYLRTVLKVMSARILNLKSIIRERRAPEISEGDISRTLNKLIDETSHCIINDKGIKLCLEADAIEEMMYNGPGNREAREKVTVTHNKLYLLNDEGFAVHNELKSLMLKQLYLKIETQNGGHKYRDFLKEQEELRIQKLQQSNPIMAQYKQKMEKTMQKINIMKKLITNFIAGSGTLLREKPVALELLENHRDILTLETISNLIQNAENS